MQIRLDSANSPIANMKLKFIDLYKTRYIFAIVFYDHAQINYRVNRALLMETCQSKKYTMIFPLCTKIQEKVILRVGESGRFF